MYVWAPSSSSFFLPTRLSVPCQVHQFIAEPLAESIIKETEVQPVPDLKTLVDVSSLGRGTMALDVRWLPPRTTLTELWQTAFTGISPAPSYSTFVRVFHNGKWNRMLRFRTESQHSKCTTCEKLKEFKRLAYSKGDVDRVLESYHQHLTSMIKDRQADARINSLAVEAVQSKMGSSTGHHGSVLSMTLDGMDCSKFKVPRNIPYTKSFSSMHRPELKCVGAIVEGLQETFFIVSDNVTKDANLQLTLLGHILNDTYQHCLSSGVRMPATVRIHSDNGPSELKNQWTLKWSAFMLHHKYFQRVVLSQFLVGHSHSKIDQRFSECRNALSRANVLQDIDARQCFFGSAIGLRIFKIVIGCLIWTIITDRMISLAFLCVSDRTPTASGMSLPRVSRDSRAANCWQRSPMVCGTGRHTWASFQFQYPVIPKPLPRAVST